MERLITRISIVGYADGPLGVEPKKPACHTEAHRKHTPWKRREHPSGQNDSATDISQTSNFQPPQTWDDGHMNRVALRAEMEVTHGPNMRVSHQGILVL